MLRDCDPGRKTSDSPCPKCGTAGDYAVHGSYERWLDDGTGARRVRVNRVKCRSCGKTHALIWAGMSPYRLRSEAVCAQVAHSRSRGASVRSLSSSTGIPMTSMRRILADRRRSSRTRPPPTT